MKLDDLLTGLTDAFSALADAAMRQAEETARANAASRRGHTTSLTSDAMAVARSPHLLAALGIKSFLWSMSEFNRCVEYQFVCATCGAVCEFHVEDKTFLAADQPMMVLIERIKAEVASHRCAGIPIIVDGRNDYIGIDLDPGSDWGRVPAPAAKSLRRDSLGQCRICGADKTMVCDEVVHRDPLAEWRRRNACDVCWNRPDDDGEILHGKGCFVVSSGGGGYSSVDEDPPIRWASLDGQPHIFGGGDRCCAILGRTCNRCGAFEHGTPVYGGIATLCEQCDASEFTYEPMPDELRREL